MACVALTSLRTTLKLEFLKPNNPRVSLDDEASISIKSLHENLSSLQAFLQKKSGSGAAIRDLELKIRDFALEAEDHIEIQLSNFVLAKNEEDQPKASQQLNQTLGETVENAAKLLKISNEFADDDEEMMIMNKSNDDEPIPWLKHAAFEANNVMVGRRHDHLPILNQLTRGSRELAKISIVGMTSIGKTTLAASVYTDPLIESYFEVRGWITMSGEPDESQMLHDVLWTIAEGIKIPDDLTFEKVSKFLIGKRYLIVLDNLFDNNGWHVMSPCFPSGHNGSRIVITTTHLSGDYHDSYHYIHHMTLLNPEESWDLFCNKFCLEQNMEPKLKKIRSQIVEKCEGLPHTIAVVAKRLSKCDNIQQEWKKVEKEIELLGVLDSKTLTLTYNQLPQHLKGCFLYFGVFPKRSAIRVKLLIRLWINEGFIDKELEDDDPFFLWSNVGFFEPSELEKHAYAYLEELICRCLILIDTMSTDDKVKSCRMRSVWHSFCVREAQREGIFCALNIQQLSRGSFSMFANSCRWLSLYTHSFDYYVLLRENTPRSVLFFQEDVEIYVPFKLLRVLAFVPSSFLQRVPTRLHELVFLRYLSISEWFEGLDYVVSTNRNLQTLVVYGKESQFGAPTLHLPSTIWESPRLEHLELDKSYAIDPPSMEKDNMQTLSWVCPTHCRTRVYNKFPNIKKLKLFVFGNNLITLDNLEYLKRLEKLSILVWFGCIVTLPKPSMFPSQLKKLRLNGTNLSERDLRAIGLLPCLEVLKLENAFRGEIWEVALGTFRELKFLLLEHKTLKKWCVGPGSFQCLKYLVLRFCYCLEELPTIIEEDFDSLKSIEFQECCSTVIASAERILEYHQHELGNEDFKIKIVGLKLNMMNHNIQT